MFLMYLISTLINEQEAPPTQVGLKWRLHLPASLVLVLSGAGSSLVTPDDLQRR